MKMHTLTIAALLLVSGIISLSAAEFTNIYDIDVNGTWTSNVQTEDRFARLVFEGNEFSMTLRIDGKEITRKGYFLQEAKRILLVVVNGDNHQSQMEVPYYVIDDDTMEITFNERTFMLERVS